MEQNLIDLLIKNLPFTSKVLLIALVTGSGVFYSMKLYGRFEQTEKTTMELKEWSKEVDKRLDNLELRMEKVEDKIDKLDAKIDDRFDTVIKLLMEKKK